VTVFADDQYQTTEKEPSAYMREKTKGRKKEIKLASAVMFGNRRISTDDTIRQHRRTTTRPRWRCWPFRWLPACRLGRAQPVGRRQTVDGGRRAGAASVGRPEPTRRIIDLRSRGCRARRHVIIQWSVQCCAAELSRSDNISSIPFNLSTSLSQICLLDCLHWFPATNAFSDNFSLISATVVRRRAVLSFKLSFTVFQARHDIKQFKLRWEAVALQKVKISKKPGRLAEW